MGLLLGLLGCSFPGSPGQAADGAPVDGAVADAAVLGAWTNITRLEELEVLGNQAYDDPALADDYEIFFAGPAVTGGGQDLFSAELRSDGVYEMPTRIDELSTNVSESTVWISGDGLTIAFGRTTDPGTGIASPNIHVATRTSRGAMFNAAAPISETAGAINTDSVDAMGAFTTDMLTLYFASNRDGNYDVFVAKRLSASDPFTTVEKVAASQATRDEINPKLSADGLSLYMVVRDPPGGSGIAAVHVSERPDPSAPFVGDAPLAELVASTDTEDFNPHSTHRTAVFASERDVATGRIYRATR